MADTSRPLNLFEPVDTPAGFAVTPGQVDIDHGSDAPYERPAFSRTFSAAWQQDNTVASWLASETANAPEYVQEGYNPWDSIKGGPYEAHFARFAHVRNSEWENALKRQIDREEENRKTLEAAPWWQQFPAELVAGTLDWPSLIPGGAFVKGAKGGFDVVRSAAVVGGAAGVGAAAQEVGLHASQETRTAGETATNIGASIFLGGLLGAGGAALLSPAEWAAGVNALNEDLARVGARRTAEQGTVPDIADPASVGAAARPRADREDLSIAGAAAGRLAQATKGLNPALRTLQRESAEARLVGTQMFENSVYMKGNFADMASEHAVETLMKEWNGGLATAVKATNDAFSDYVKASGGNFITKLFPRRAGLMSRDEFRQAVGRAMREGDVGDNEFVTRVAEQWRSKVFDPLKNEAIKLKLLPEDVSVETATSYFTRMWNRNKLIAREAEFKGVVTRWVEEMTPQWAEAFDKETERLLDTAKGQATKATQPAKVQELERRVFELEIERRTEREARFGDEQTIKWQAKKIADEVHATLTGRAGPTGSRPEFITVNTRGPMEKRTFNISDALVQDFLESDVEAVGRRYARVMGADVELARKFGRPDMRDQIERIREDYARMREGVTEEKVLRRLGDDEKGAIQDIEAMRDLLRGTYQPHAWDQSFATISRIANHFNYIRSMGNVVLTNLTDAVRPAMVHGLMPYLQTTGQLATNLKGVRMAVKEAQLGGNVLERVLAHRMATISEIIDPYQARGPFEKFVENMSNVASSWNGIRVWTDGVKSFSSVIIQNRILKAATNFANIKDSERAYLRFLGINDYMAGRIAEHFRAHGETVDGVLVANTEKWVREGKRDDLAIRAYRAAMNKDLDSTVVQKSVADVPLFANTPLGRTVLQFKSFALASHQKVLMRGLQESPARFTGGIVALTTLGMMQVYLKAVSANRTDKLQDFAKNPGWWVAEGIDNAGIFGPLLEGSNAFEKMTTVNPIKSPLTMFDEGNAESQKIQNRGKAGALLGPTVGSIDDMFTALGIPATTIAGDDIKQAQKNAAVRLLPYRSYAGIQQMLNYVINPPH